MFVSMDSYYVQAIGISLSIILIFSKKAKIDLFPLIATFTWLIGVSSIYFRYGLNQSSFYSNDQDVHLRIVRQYIESEGLSFSGIIPLRYLITFPTFLLSKIGFHEILVLKTFQILSLIGIYFKSKSILLSSGISLKYWHFAFVASPLMFFFSLLALRDLTLAYFTILYIFESKVQRRGFFIALIFLLKPHLAVALLFGTIALFLFTQIKAKRSLFMALIFIFISYVFGSVSYSIGAFFKDRFYPGLPAEVFSQEKFSQLSLNFSGLQFFSLINEKKSVVSTPTHFLLLARIVLFDTFLIPLSFLFISVFMLRQMKSLSFLIFTSFVFYLGIVSQSDFNSTRQNIPYLAAMGIISVVNIEASLKLRHRNLRFRL